MDEVSPSWMGIEGARRWKEDSRWGTRDVSLFSFFFNFKDHFCLGDFALHSANVYQNGMTQSMIWESKCILEGWNCPGCLKFHSAYNTGANLETPIWLVSIMVINNSLPIAVIRTRRNCTWWWDRYWRRKASSMRREKCTREEWESEWGDGGTVRYGTVEMISIDMKADKSRIYLVS